MEPIHISNQDKRTYLYIWILNEITDVVYSMISRVPFTQSILLIPDGTVGNFQSFKNIWIKTKIYDILINSIWKLIFPNRAKHTVLLVIFHIIVSLSLEFGSFDRWPKCLLTSLQTWLKFGLRVFGSTVYFFFQKTHSSTSNYYWIYFCVSISFWLLPINGKLKW